MTLLIFVHGIVIFVNKSSFLCVYFKLFEHLPLQNPHATLAVVFYGHVFRKTVRINQENRYVITGTLNISYDRKLSPLQCISLYVQYEKNCIFFNFNIPNMFRVVTYSLSISPVSLSISFMESSSVPTRTHCPSLVNLTQDTASVHI